MKQVLLVDDDPRVLSGLERMLRPYRARWSILTATDGHVALETMDHVDVDVIVTDMRMPGMDGAELLRRVREAHPDVVRIVLSGQMNGASSIRTASVAHQYLTKPCDAAVLIEVIQRTCDLRTSTYPPALQRALGHISSLPSPGTTITELDRVISSGDIDLEQISDIVSRDPAITAKVLQLVNSAFFGLPHSVGDIRTAITYLGVITLRHLLLATDVFRAFEDEATFLQRRDLDVLQSRAIAVAAKAADLVESRSDREWAFLAGLVHDVGILALTTCRLEDLGIDSSLTGSIALRKVEHALGVSHPEIGAYLLTIWGVPDTVVQAVADHHGSEAAGVLGTVSAAVRDAVSAIERSS